MWQSQDNDLDSLKIWITCLWALKVELEVLHKWLENISVHQAGNAMCYSEPWTSGRIISTPYLVYILQTPMENLPGAINQAKGLGIEEGRAQKLPSTRDVEVDPVCSKNF